MLDHEIVKILQSELYDGNCPNIISNNNFDVEYVSWVDISTNTSNFVAGDCIIETTSDDFDVAFKATFTINKSGNNLTVEWGICDFYDEVV